MSTRDGRGSPTAQGHRHLTASPTSSPVGRRASGRARAAAGLIALLLAATAWLAPTATAATTVDGNTQAAALQAMLDRTLGPGGAYVSVTEEVTTSTGTSTSVRYGAAVPQVTAGRRAVVPGVGTAQWGTQQDAVGQQVTTTVTPPGEVTREDVTVAVDRRRLGTTSTATLKRLLRSAAGLQTARGDRLVLLVAVFPVAPATAPAATTANPFLPWIRPGIWGAGVVLAVLFLLVTFRRRRPRQPTPQPSA